MVYVEVVFVVEGGYVFFDDLCFQFVVNIGDLVFFDGIGDWFVDYQVLWQQDVVGCDDDLVIYVVIVFVCEYEV